MSHAKHKARRMVAVKGDQMHQFEVMPNLSAAKAFIMRIKDMKAITFPVAVLDISDPEELVEQVANALACEHMGAMEGSYSLTPEASCRKGSESAYMWRSARIVLESLGLLAKKRGKR